MTFPCPSCDKTLRQNAKSCDCGWEKEPKSSLTKSPLLAHSLDHQCMYNDHGTRCRYPVNFFEPGQTRSFCRYHKKHIGDLEMCQKIVARSHRDTDAEYQKRADLETYGEKRSQMEQDVYDGLYKTREQARQDELNRAAA